MKRNTHTLQCRMDPLSQDRLQWIQACLAKAIPDMKVPSQSTIVRRALEAYVSYLGNIFATGKINHQNVTKEAAHYAIARQNNPVHWSDGVFPVEGLVKEDGTLVRFDLMEKAARATHRDSTLKKLFDSEKSKHE